MVKKKALDVADTPSVPMIRPGDIPLAEGVDLGGGAMFVKLETFEALNTFWINNMERMEFAVEGGGGGNFLRQYEWVFGPTKQSVVKAVMRWDALEIRCEWFDSYAEDPQFHNVCLEDMRCARTDGIAKGNWDAIEELSFKDWEAGKYKGNWILVNLPLGETHYGLFCDPDRRKDIGDIHEKDVDPRFVELSYQKRIFDESESDLSVLGDGLWFRTRRDMTTLVQELRDNPEELEAYFAVDEDHQKSAH
jgi:hypothetical protein